ncbi:MAG: diguanylate cyclase, partial [Gammaproteobacteria bacterium]|nr:diguanylate cyclase [Gammaproteobacteria bacterium]
MNRHGRLTDFLFHSIKGRLISGVLLLHAVLMGLVVWDMMSRQQDFMTSHIADTGQVLADSMAVNAPSWVLSHDVNALDELVTSFKSIENLRMAAVLDSRGRVLAATDPGLFNMTLTDEISVKLLDALRNDPARLRHQQWHDGVIDSLTRVVSSGKPVGYVRVILDASPVQTELNAISMKGLAYTLIAVMLGGFVAWLLVRKMTYRLELLSDAADRIASGDLEVNLPQYAGRDEVARLTLDFNLMTSSLLRNRQERDRAAAALHSEKERALVTLQSIGDAVITTDMEGRVESLNPVAEALTGWSDDEAKGRPLTDVFNIISEVTRLPTENPVEKALRANAVVALANHTVLIRRDGTEVQIEDSAAPIRGRDGNILGVVLVFHDVSEKRRLTNQLTHQASHDALTGLINRGEFERRLETMIRSALEDGRQHAMLYLDLDQFKVVNDTCGHGAGDELLRQLPAHLTGCLRESDTFARLGGDEFGVLLDSCSLEHAQQVATELLDQVRAFRFSWFDKTFTVGASIGLVAITDSSGNAASVLAAADTACYAAKDKGRNRVQLYSPNDAEMARRHGEMHWLARITKAFEE